MPEDPRTAEDDEIDETRMTLGEHLDELRSRLIKGLLAIAVAFFAGYAFRDTVAAIVLRPLHQAMDRIEAAAVREAERAIAEDGVPRQELFDASGRLLHSPVGVVQTTAAGESFFFAVKVVLIFSIAAGSPVLLWQLWRFVAAGLYRRERRALLKYFPYAVILLLAGMLFGYFVLLPWGMYFMQTTLRAPGTVFNPKMSEYLSLAVAMTLTLGAVFQLPLVIYALIRLDIVPRETFTKYRPHFIVGAFFVAAVVTPPDPYTQMMVALPMIALFELGILSARIAGRREPAA